jgi:hypothetical protein
MPQAERTKLCIDINAFDTRVEDDESFRILQTNTETKFKKILLRKEIEKK